MVEKKRNLVFIEGYLKENNLEQTTSRNGDDVIKGSIVIAVNEEENYRMTYFITRKLRDGTERSEWAKLVSLLPKNTMSIASYLLSTPTANWDVAKNQASKVYALGEFEEYVRKDGKMERSSIVLRGRKGGLKTIEDRNPFSPRATFEVEGYIETKTYEEKNNEQTGRIIMGLLVPSYNGSMHRISLVAGEPKVVTHVDNNYFVGQTAYFTGKLNCIKRVIKEADIDETAWGSAATSNVESIFVREREITGGKNPLNADDKEAITKEDVKSGLVLRQEQIDRLNSSRGGESKAVSATTPAAEVPSGFESPTVQPTTVTPKNVGDFAFDDDDF